MSAKKKKKKKNRAGSVLLRLLVLLVFLLLAGVALWQLRGVFSGNATTAIVRADTLGNSYSGTLVIARNERT